MGHPPLIGQKRGLPDAESPAGALKDLGTIPAHRVEQILDPSGKGPISAWTSPTGQTVELVEPPPPWELRPDGQRDELDARRYVRAPDNIVFRWVNPRVVDRVGLREWQVVPAAGDPKFTVLERQMIRPDNTIRRGGSDGDMLCWMWRSWVERRREIMRLTVQRQQQSAVERHHEVRERLAAGAFGPYIKDGGGAHPSHTQLDGRTMEKD